jgi:hypothetical protein
MKPVILVSTLGLLLVSSTGCNGEADIGIDSEPRTCSVDTPTAEVHGSVIDPNTGTEYDFGAAGATMIADASGGGTLSISDQSLILRLGFYCGTRDPGTYDLGPDDQSEQLHCPLHVLGAVLGRIEYLPTDDGVVIVDESANCLAGRFRADFGEYGELTGWFSAPYQQTP